MRAPLRRAIPLLPLLSALLLAGAALPRAPLSSLPLLALCVLYVVAGRVRA